MRATGKQLASATKTAARATQEGGASAAPTKATAPASEGGRYKSKGNPRGRPKAVPTKARNNQVAGRNLCDWNRWRPEGRRYAGLEDGAGLGYVGVKFVDYVGVLLFDYAALEFHGEGQAAGVEGEIVGEKGKALDGFVLS